MVFLWGCFSGGVVVWWCFCGDRWCGGVCVVVFLFWCGGVFVLVCFCGGVVEVFLCFCDGVFFCQGSAFVALPRSYAKSVDKTGVKRCLV